MATVGTLLDDCQRFLRDRGRLWPRTELRRWLLDGYTRLLAQSQAVRQFSVLTLPPRQTFSLTYGWERRYTWQGTWRLWTLAGVTGERVFTTAWEAAAAEGLTPPAGYTAVTQLWELAYTGQVETSYRVALPRPHERVCGVWWDHKRLEAISVRELDAVDDMWPRQQGEPWWWTPGTGESRSLELYEIRTAYEDGYTFVDWERLGMPRRLEGERIYTAVGVPATPSFSYTTDGDAWFLTSSSGSTFFVGFGQRLPSDTIGPTLGTAAWEADYGATNFGDYGLGLIRRVTSPERQYLPQASWQAPLGLQRDWRSSAQALLLWEAVVPDVPDVEESMAPDMVPPPLHKYLRYYVLAMAYNRQGEGYRPDLAAHWQLRWERGLKLCGRLGTTTQADTTSQRQPVTRRVAMPPAPQWPPDFPQMRW